MINTDDVILLEPKLDDRFIVYINHIPANLIKFVKRPIITVNNNKYVYGNIVLGTYNTIQKESTVDILTKNNIINFDKIEINILGPIGEISEIQTYKNAKIVNIKQSDLDWSSRNTVSMTEITFSFETVEYSYK